MSCLPGICTISLGRAAAGHTLATKLDMASKHGFKGIELFHEDLLSIAQENRLTASKHQPPASPSKTVIPTSTDPITPAEELAAAHSIRSLCDQRGLSIICLQPFWQYEGLLDREEHNRQLNEKLPLWFQLCEALGTDLIQVPSNFLPADQLSSDPNVAIEDLREMADAGLAFGRYGVERDDYESSKNPSFKFADRKMVSTNDNCNNSSNDISTTRRPIRFAYEALAWGTHTSTWESAYATVLAVDRPNFGLLLDTFNIAGCATFADPSSPTGMVENAHQKLTASLKKLVEEVDVSKVFYVQIASAERLAKPLVEGHELWNAEQDGRMSWSRGCRLFYGEEGVSGDEEGSEEGDDVQDNGLRPVHAGESGEVESLNGMSLGDISTISGGVVGHGTDEDGDMSFGKQRGEYLPITQICSAIFKHLGYRGWISMEVFHRETWNAQNSNVPREFAQRGRAGWETLKSDFGLDDNDKSESDCGCGVGEEEHGSATMTAVDSVTNTMSADEMQSEDHFVAVGEMVTFGGCESADDADDEAEHDEDGDGAFHFL